MTVGCNTVDIQDIKIDDGGAQAIGWGAETFAIWEGVPSVVAGSDFQFWDPSYDPECAATGYYWGDGECNKVSYSFKGGQGVVINCAEGYTFGTSGEVKKDNLEFTTIQDNNFSGNPFGAAIDIQDISLDDGGAQAIGWGAETFAIWEGVPSVVAGSDFQYWDPSYDPECAAVGYYWGDAECNKVSYPIPAGQGFVINCAAGYTVTVTAPYSL